MTVGRAVLVLPMQAVVPHWFGEAAAAGVDVVTLGPRRWLLCSDMRSGTEIIAAWTHRLLDSAYVFEDAGDRFVCLPVRGVAATIRLSQQLLRSVDGLPEAAVTTLLGDVPVVCHVRPDGVDVLVDRSLVHYAEEWLQQTLADA